jgi:hypothetical protein
MHGSCAESVISAGAGWKSWLYPSWDFHTARIGLESMLLARSVTDKILPFIVIDKLPIPKSPVTNTCSGIHAVCSL